MATQRCLYEILGVERTASIEEIRSAYRKLALKWHPDKIQQSGASPSACQEATIHFQDIVSAYEVLSDPSERSWYDSHRSQILSSSSASSSDFDFNPWPYFSASVYSGYGDTGNGFYSVYGELFIKLHQQEKDFTRSHGLPPPFDPPDMGDLATDYGQVQKFYNHWSGFSTVKDFSWCDEFRASDGPNRKLRRLMEEENRKIRSKARKEYNEAIRRLVAFVKKRDKRVLERQVEVQRLEREKEELRKARFKKSEEEKKLKAKLFKEAEWTKVATNEDDGEDVSDYDDSLGSYSWVPAAASNSNAGKKDRNNEFYCVICNKKFKSDEQWRNHERSKKHLEKVAILKETFEEEDKEFEALENDQVVSEDCVEETSNTSDSVVELRSENNVVGSRSYILSDDREPFNAVENLHEANKNRPSSHENASNETGSEKENGEDDEAASLLNMINSYTGRQQQQQSTVEVTDHSNEAREDDEEEEMLATWLKSRQSQQQVEQNEDEEDDRAGSSSFDVTKDVEDEPMQEAGGIPRKRRSKARARIERPQVASLNRHVRLMEELFLGESSQASEGKREDASNHENATEDGCVTLEMDEPRVTKAEENLLFGRGNRASKLKTTNGRTIPETEHPRKPTRGKKSKGTAKNTANTCETCGEDFESRNQLFKHISITKHAALKGK